jgi:hypothetical protein
LSLSAIVGNIRHRTAQNRRGLTSWTKNILGAPSFSPYRTPFLARLGAL